MRQLAVAYSSRREGKPLPRYTAAPCPAPKCTRRQHPAHHDPLTPLTSPQAYSIATELHILPGTTAPVS